MKQQEHYYSLVVKKDCPTCALIEPVIKQLSETFNDSLAIYVQDDPSFPENVITKIDDSSLEFSYKQNIEIVPTLIRSDNGLDNQARIFGWNKSEWQELTGIENLGANLVDSKPGCGSKTQDPGMNEILTLRIDTDRLRARKIELAESEDIMEACFERGWSDGLRVVPPTLLRVTRMLSGTDLSADEIIGSVPPDNKPCTVEKIAINAVMAGCKPDHLQVVIAALKAALQDEFCMHGLLCTTYFSAPVMIVNGPITQQIGMNSGVNALGQGNRANATIGRALQLIIRNVGGGMPGGIDRATLGTPGKYTFCFSEDESDTEWPSLAMDRGYNREDSVINLFAGSGVQPFVDQLSRQPESLVKNLGNSLRSVANTRSFGMADAMIVISPEHRRVLRQDNWTKADLKKALYDELITPGADIIRGKDGIAEGMPEKFKDMLLNKFRDDGLHIVGAGGKAGMFSAIISGWLASGDKGSQLVSQQIN